MLPNTAPACGAGPAWAKPGTWEQVVAVLVAAVSSAALVAADVAALVAFGVPLTMTVLVAHPATDAAMMAESSARARSCGAWTVLVTVIASG